MNVIDFEQMRHAMVASQLRPNAVNDPRVVAAMAQVPRERFVPSEQASFAYADTAVKVGRGRAINLPIATGRLLTQALVRPEDRVLLIAAAGGYAAALLSVLAHEVVAVESDATLAAFARGALAEYDNVTLIEAPLEAGAPELAPYDLLVIDGAVDHLPEDLAAQLALGGRIVTGVVDNSVTRLAAGRRTGGGFGLQDFADCDCVVLPGFSRPRGFRF